MRRTARPRLSDWVKAAASVASARETAEGDGRGNEQGEGGEEEKGGLESRADAVELLGMVFQSPEEEGSAEHEERIRDDGSGDGGFHEQVFSGAQGRESDDEFGQIPEGGIEEAAHGIAGLRGNGLGGMTEEGGERDDGEDGEDEQQGV